MIGLNYSVLTHQNIGLGNKMKECAECSKTIEKYAYCYDCYVEAAELWNFIVLNHPRIYKKFQKLNSQNTEGEKE